MNNRAEEEPSTLIDLSSLSVQEPMPVDITVRSVPGSDVKVARVYVDGIFQNGVHLRRRKKEKIRFAIGDPSDPRRRGNVFNVSSGKNDDDVYVSFASWLGGHKFSLHASGDWRYQLDSRDVLSADPPQYFSARAEEVEDRILHQWCSPGADENGLLTLWQVGMPGDDLGHYPQTLDLGDNKTLCVPAGGRREITLVTLIAVDPDQGRIRLGSLVPGETEMGFLKGILLHSGRALLCFWATLPISPEDRASFRRMREEAARGRPDHIINRRMLYVEEGGPWPIAYDLKVRDWVSSPPLSKR